MFAYALNAIEVQMLFEMKMKQLRHGIGGLAMYINPFVFGVLATVGAEILALVVAAVWMFFRGNK